MSIAENAALHWQFTGSEGRITGSEDRIRQVLQLAPSQALPMVDEQSLQQYYRKLAPRLVLPFKAEYSESTGPERQIVVTRLIDPGCEADLDAGLMCEAWQGAQPLTIALADVCVAPRHPNHPDVEDYWYWFWNWRPWLVR